MEKNEIKKEQFLKLNFFKKIWYSITKFEKYPELATLGVKKALIYFTELILIFCIIYTGVYVYYIDNIAEFEDEDMNLSQKLISVLFGGEEQYTEEMTQIVGQMGNESQNAIIISLFISVFIAFYFATLVDVFTLSFFGVITCFMAKIKMNYKAVFNMSIYALTLSIILRIIYVVINVLTQFEIKYFEIMYIAVSYISLAAAIFLIKSDVIKQHLELMKILEESKEKIEEKILNPKKPKEEDEDKEEEKETKKEKENNEGTEEQGSNA